VLKGICLSDIQDFEGCTHEELNPNLLIRSHKVTFGQVWACLHTVTKTLLTLAILHLSFARVWPDCDAKKANSIQLQYQI
jgi:hypothetical protein